MTCQKSTARRRWIAAIAACVTSAGLAHLAAAQTAAPTAAPATEPAMTAPATTRPMATSIPVDASTPRGALKSLISAMESGDGDKIKSLIATTSPSEDKMVAAMANMSISQKKFRDAANGAFGANAKDLVGDTATATAEGMAKVDSAKETIDGNKAVVDSGSEGAGPQGGTPPLTLTKTGDSWKIPITELSRDVDPATINQRLEDLSFMSTLMNDSATEMSKGTYKTPKDANDAIKNKMMMAMMKRSAAATQATTMPAGGAAPTNAPGSSSSNTPSNPPGNP